MTQEPSGLSCRDGVSVNLNVQGGGGTASYLHFLLDISPDNAQPSPGEGAALLPYVDEEIGPRVRNLPKATEPASGLGWSPALLGSRVQALSSWHVLHPRVQVGWSPPRLTSTSMLPPSTCS